MAQALGESEILRSPPTHSFTGIFQIPLWAVPIWSESRDQGVSTIWHVRFVSSDDFLRGRISSDLRSWNICFWSLVPFSGCHSGFCLRIVSLSWSRRFLCSCICDTARFHGNAFHLYLLEETTSTLHCLRYRACSLRCHLWWLIVFLLGGAGLASWVAWPLIPRRIPVF